MPARTYTKAPVYTAPEAVYNWTGFYIGGNIGGAFAGNNSLEGSGGRFMGGVQGGFDYQFAHQLGDRCRSPVQLARQQQQCRRAFPGRYAGDREQQPARLGHRPARLHLGSGAALRQGRLRLARQPQYRGQSFAGTPVAFTTDGTHKDGYTVGAGLEYMFAPNWSAKAEYQYYNFGNTTFTGGPAEIVGSRFRNDEHTVKVGVNYRFGWGGPVAAQY